MGDIVLQDLRMSAFDVITIEAELLKNQIKVLEQKMKKRITN